LTYFFFRAFLQICAWLPLPLLHGLGTLWGFLLSVVPNRARQTTRINLDLCFPELDPAARSRLCRESLQQTACTALEMGKAWLLPMAKTLKYVKATEGDSEFSAALAAGEPVIVLAPHLGNWEVFGFYVSKNIPSTWLYQPPRQPAIDQLLLQTRSRSGIHLAPTNRQGVSMLLKALQRCELVGVLPDQVPTEDGGVYAPFFGKPALTMSLISRLIKGRQVKVYCGCAERLTGGRGFRIHIRRVNDELYSDDLETSVAALNASVEALVRELPAQYQWEYKRFRRMPDGKKIYK